MVTMPSHSLAGQVAVITGASRGIGREVAIHLSGLGAAVAGIARPSADLTSLADAAGSGAGRLMPVPADVTSAASVHAAFDAVQARFGPPTLVLTCAGTAGELGPAWSADPRAWWDAVAVDLLGTLLTAQSAIERMRAAGTGRLVTVYGNLGERQLGNVSAFAVAKAGIARFTESLACELDGTGVQVFAMHPGFVRTPMTELLAWGDRGRTWLPGFGQGVEQRWGDGGAAAELVAAIASGAADELTGRVLGQETISTRWRAGAGPIPTTVGFASSATDERAYGVAVPMKLALVVRTDLDMGRGKIAAQVAHAAVAATLASLGGAAGHRWLADGQPKVVLKASSAEQLEDLAGQARRAGLPVELVRDAGRTQVRAGTLTCCAIGPAEAEQIDAITARLALL